MLDASAADEMYGDKELGQLRLSDIVDESLSHRDTNTDNPEEWVFVYARVQRVNSVMYSEGVYRVRRTSSSSPLVEGSEWVSLDDLVERMDKKRQRQKVMPSVQGEYLDVKEVYLVEQEDGTVRLDEHNSIETIPVELVYSTLTHHEAIEMLDD